LIPGTSEEDSINAKGLQIILDEEKGARGLSQENTTARVLHLLPVTIAAAALSGGRQSARKVYRSEARNQQPLFNLDRDLPLLKPRYNIASSRQTP
jgi:hypothetical protein